MQQNMYQQQPYYGYGQQPMMQQPMMPNYYGAYQQQPQFAYSNITGKPSLTKEEIDALTKEHANVLNLMLTDEERMIASCNHVDLNGSLRLTPVDTTGHSNLYRCDICGSTVDLKQFSVEEVQHCCDTITNYLQAIKIYSYADPSAVSICQGFMPIIAMIQKIPKLFQYSEKNIKNITSNTSMINNTNMFQPASSLNPVAEYNNIISGIPGNSYNMAAQGFNPMYGGQPMMPQGYPQMNPQMAGQPAPQQMPQYQQPQMMPQMPQPQMPQQQMSQQQAGMNVQVDNPFGYAPQPMMQPQMMPQQQCGGQCQHQHAEQKPEGQMQTKKEEINL